MDTIETLCEDLEHNEMMRDDALGNQDLYNHYNDICEALNEELRELLR